MTRKSQRGKKKVAAVAAFPPALPFKREKKMALTKKQLIQQEKAARRQQRGRANHDRDDDDMSSMFGPLARANFQRNNERLERHNSNNGRRKKSPQITVVMDGAAIHYNVKNCKNTVANRKRPPKTPNFRLQPIHNPKNCRVPWWTDDHRQDWLTANQTVLHRNNSPNSKRRHSPPKKVGRHYFFGRDPPHDAWLSLLDAELRAFAHYVQVSEGEIQARNFVVSTLETVSKSNLDCVPSHRRDHVRVQVFGSFATPPVCAFCSDVDVALHGVVDPPEAATHTRFTGSAADPPEDKVQKWRDLLQELDKEQVAEKPKNEGSDPDEDDDDDDAVVVDEHHFQPDFDDDNHQHDAWENHLDQLLEGANEAPDYRLRSDSCVSAGSAGRSGEVVDLTESTSGEEDDDDRKPAAKKTKREEVVIEDKFFVVDRVGVEVVDLNSDNEDVNGTHLKDDFPPNTRQRSLSAGTAPSGSDSEDDTEDKMASLQKRKMDIPSLSSPLEDAAERAVVSLSSDDDEYDSDLHMTNRPSPNHRSAGPEGAVRAKVVNALGALGNVLRKRRFTQSVQVIKFARVPIVKFETKLGFEADVAMGGHNGTDTSQFALSQVDKFESFAVVVMALKIMLWQQKLDTPFNGGLGSYKLYVLVAYHLERHLQMGGNDRPGEVFLSFLFRYGWVRRGIGIFDHCDNQCRTFLQVSSMLECEGGYKADMSATFLLKHCVEFFQRCFMKIGNTHVSRHAPKNGSSILVDLFNVEKLIEDRTESLEKADTLDQFCKASKRKRREEAEQQMKRGGSGRGQAKNKLHK